VNFSQALLQACSLAVLLCLTLPLSSGMVNSLGVLPATATAAVWLSA